MNQSPSSETQPQTETLRQKRNLLFFRAWICLQLAHTLLIVGIIYQFIDRRILYVSVPEQVRGLIFGFQVLLLPLSPSMAIMSLSKTSLGRAHKCAWFVVVLSLYLLALLLFWIPGV